jgi:hypothetical protein
LAGFGTDLCSERPGWQPSVLALKISRSGISAGFSALLSFVAATILELFIGSTATVGDGAMAGFFAALGWVATLLGILYLFEMRSLSAYLINAGYCVVSLTIMGLVLGAW